MGQMGGADGDGDGGGGPHHQYHYQALLAAVQNPSQGLHPFPLPFHLPLHAGAPAAGQSLSLLPSLRILLHFPSFLNGWIVWTGCLDGLGTEGGHLE